MIKTKFKTLIIEDETVVASQIITLFSEHPDYDVIGEPGATVQEGKRFIDEHTPDFVLLDIELVYDKSGGIKLAEYLQDKKAAFAFLTMHNEDSRIVKLALEKQPLKLIPKSDLGIDLPPLNHDNKKRRENILMRLTLQLEQYFRERYIFVEEKEKVQISDIIYVKSFKNSKIQTVNFYLEGKNAPVYSFKSLKSFDEDFKRDHPHFHYIKLKDYIINLDKIKDVVHIKHPKNPKYRLLFDMNAFENSTTLNEINISRAQLTTKEANQLHDKFPKVVSRSKKKA